MRLMFSIIALSCGLCWGQTTQTYQYDELGNREVAANQVRFTAARGFGVDPPFAVPGDRINIYGTAFPVDNPLGYSVSFNGTPGTVVSVSSRVVTVEVPMAASPGNVLLTLPDMTQLDVGAFLYYGLVITPESAEMDYDDSVQFTTTVYGATMPNVIWAVEGTLTDKVGADLGSIDASGLYTAPSAASAGVFPVLISATETETGLKAFALVNLGCQSSQPIAYGQVLSGSWSQAFERRCYSFTGSAGDRVYLYYESHTTAAGMLTLHNISGAVMGTDEGESFLEVAFITLPEDGTYSFVVVGSAASTGNFKVGLSDGGLLTAGTTLAQPLARVVLPAYGDPMGLGLNVVVGSPQGLRVSLPAYGDPGGLAANTTIAGPSSVRITLPAYGSAGDDPPNVTIARPDVVIDYTAPPKAE